MAATNPIAYGLTSRDMVLAAFACTDDRQREVIAACLTAGASLILVNAETMAHDLVDAIEQKGVTVMATTSELWQKIHSEMNHGRREHSNRIRTLVFNGNPESKMHEHLM